MEASPFAQRPCRLLLDVEQSPPLESHGNKPRDPYGGNEATFDKNMVIILAVLLCALIFALGLNSIVRCALRCSRRLSLETGSQATGRMAATGLKKSALRRIPVSVYQAGLGIPAATAATECPICLGEFEDGEKVRVLPQCHHGFHVGCIDTWLISHSSCPTCRQSLLEPNPPPSAVSDAAGNAVTELSVTADPEFG